ncbi:hypothetical protein J2T57_002631 [Natronocella acetinitrilica]|uniref:Uncharacterized protein n=1 Tax=Natronocella acetinitrilica TaxID=414046 RepID=A0AAE3G476_9GAMM|nr:hypothetical protein [Natronocella acetinitrilica]MCP1675481.1 hypothetical protein [Natronocella acetinitrilica]
MKENAMPGLSEIQTHKVTSWVPVEHAAPDGVSDAARITGKVFWQPLLLGRDGCWVAEEYIRLFWCLHGAAIQASNCPDDVAWLGYLADTMNSLAAAARRRELAA